MPKFNSRPVDTREALAAAVVLYKQNNNKILLHTYTNSNSTKQLLIDHFNKVKVINGLDLESADEIIKVIQHEITVRTLAERSITDFLNRVYELITQDSVPLRHMSFIAWAPKLADSINKENSQNEILNKFKFTSQYFGSSTAGMAQLNITIIEQKYIRYYDSYRYIAHTDTNNLILFYAKKKFSSKITIRAKVKSHHDDNGYKFTRLHFVKGLK